MTCYEKKRVYPEQISTIHHYIPPVNGHVYGLDPTIEYSFEGIPEGTDISVVFKEPVIVHRVFIDAYYDNDWWGNFKKVRLYD